VATDANGGSAVVEYTLRGAHSGKVLHIVTEGGHDITTSDGHVFVKDDGPAPASELKVGDLLHTANGSKKITAIKMVENNEDTFCNLALAGAKPDAVSTFLGNGIIVGDINAQRNYREIVRNDIHWVKKHVASFLHTDVDSYFREKALNK
jgi:hypothetical protein